MRILICDISGNLFRPTSLDNGTGAAAICLRAFCLVLVAVLSAACGMSSRAQGAITTDASASRYFAAHGIYGFLGGNRAMGVEAYVYPMQVFRGLQVSFHTEDTAAAVPGTDVLPSMVYTPEGVERHYQGNGFEVVERLLMLPGAPAGEVEYAVQSSRTVSVQVSFVPVLDLMWPAGTGGQEIHWNPALKAYVLDEPTHRFAAVIGSPDAEGHDALSNTNAPSDSETRLHLTLHPAQVVRLVFAASTRGTSQAIASYTKAMKEAPMAQRTAHTQEEERRSRALEVVTPDADVNRALAWAEVALDQAWACNPDLGCALVAGYGPSRGISRRPQYAWFFAGDALVSLRAVLESGSFEQAKAELLFLMKFQDSKSGMMWHELSQSAAYLRWTEDYPYMFVHVDITPAFLIGVTEYVQATGDVAFAREHWEEIDLAERYLVSLIDAKDGLPRVPPGKAAHDEQEHPPQELDFAVGCLRALRDYVFLATASNQPEAVARAQKTANRLAAGIAPRFWNSRAEFWTTGINADGRSTTAVRLPSADSLALLTDAQRAAVLRAIDSPLFETTWGSRSVAANSPGFRPTDYAAGSVWAKSTTEAATALWQNGKPEAGWATWKKLVPWITADSAGHVHEVMSGIRFEPQKESVPEQTWSSALMLSSFLDGVLGLEYDATHDALTITPRLPREWSNLALRRLRVGNATLDLSFLKQSGHLIVTAAAHGSPLQLRVHAYPVQTPDGKTVTLNGQPCIVSNVPGATCGQKLAPSE